MLALRLCAALACIAWACCDQTDKYKMPYEWDQATCYGYSQTLCDRRENTYMPYDDLSSGYWPNTEVTVTLSCDSLGDEAGLPWCRDSFMSIPWTVRRQVDKLEFLDSYGQYQGPETWSAQGDKLWKNSKAVLASRGRGWDCNREDGYCRSKRVCSMKVRFFGRLVRNNQRSGAGVYEWDAANSASSAKWKLLNSYRVVGHERYLLDVPRCVHCQVSPCENTCAAGTVLGSLAPTRANEVVQILTCGKQCSPGTFLTCSGKQATCGYVPLSDAQSRAGNAGLAMWFTGNAQSDAGLLPPLLAPPPVQDCYGCGLAYGRAHYGAQVPSDASLRQKGFLQFFCPGGAEAPRPCGWSKVAKVLADNRTTSCGCQDGYYEGPRGECVLCEAGFYCSWQGTDPPRPRQCESDYYSLSGASACVPCEKSNSRCDKSQALERCEKDAAGTGQFQRRNAQCVPCTRCRELGGEIPCYRVIATITK